MKSLENVNDQTLSSIKEKDMYRLREEKRLIMTRRGLICKREYKHTFCPYDMEQIWKLKLERILTQPSILLAVNFSIVSHQVLFGKSYKT